jgi:hypothetical protein
MAELGGIVAIEVNTTELERGLRRRIDAWQRVLDFAAKEISTGIRYDFLATTRTWRTRPEFETYVDKNQDGINILVGTDNRIYSFIDKGTDAHLIEPKDPNGMLVFQWGGKGSYIAKSVPGWIGSRAGGPTGKRTGRKWVWHPGNRPRDFSKIIRWRWQGEAPRVLRKYAAAWARDEPVA